MKWILFLQLFITITISAQINESDTLKFKTKLALTGFWQSGNVETLIFRAKSDLSLIPWKKWVYKTQNSYVYQAFDKDKADEDFLSLNFLYLNPNRKIYPLMLGFVSSNFRREIDLRYIFGGGVSFSIINSISNWLKLSVTSEYEMTNFKNNNFNNNEYNGMNNIETLRATLWMNGKYELLNKKVILTHESYIQPSLLHSNNFRWQADIGAELPVWKWINFKINYIQSFESLVIENQKKQDQFLTFGLTLNSL